MRGLPASPCKLKTGDRHKHHQSSAAAALLWLMLSWWWLQPGVSCTLLYNGSRFTGHQKSKGNQYDVEVANRNNQKSSLSSELEIFLCGLVDVTTVTIISIWAQWSGGTTARGRGKCLPVRIPQNKEPHRWIPWDGKSFIVIIKSKTKVRSK